MKVIRTSLMATGLVLALLVAGTTGVRAQALHLTVFSGTAQLPLQAEWQGKTLPSGEYAVSYGTRMGGTHYVEIAGKTPGTPHLFIAPQAYSPSSSTQNELVCTRDGNHLVVLELQMSGIGESLSFANSHDAQQTSLRIADGAGSRIAAAAKQIQRVPVTLNKK
jgi:hypothetical protein